LREIQLASRRDFLQLAGCQVIKRGEGEPELFAQYESLAGLFSRTWAIRS
jgi:hypothetical protein